MRTPVLTCAVIGVVLCTQLTQCQSNSRILSPRQFSQLYQDSLSRRIPGAKFHQVDDNTFTAQKDSNTLQFNIDNAYKDYTGTPDSLGPILKRYVASGIETFNINSAANTKDNLIPMIKPASYLDQLKGMAAQMGGKKEVEYVYEPYNSELFIFYAFNTEHNIQYLTTDDLNKLGLHRDSLRPVATRNLKGIMPEIQSHGDSGMYMLTAGGDFEAEIILLNSIWEKNQISVKGDYIIGIPARDLLFVTGSADKPNLDRLKALTKKSYEEGNRTISDKLYRWDGKKFTVFE